MRANPSLISALREGTESCLAGTRASVLTSRARVAVAGEGDRLDGSYHAVVNQTKIGKSGSKKTCLDRSSPTLKLS